MGEQAWVSCPETKGIASGRWHNANYCMAAVAPPVLKVDTLLLQFRAWLALFLLHIPQGFRATIPLGLVATCSVLSVTRWHLCSNLSHDPSASQDCRIHKTQPLL